MGAAIAQRWAIARSSQYALHQLRSAGEWRAYSLGTPVDLQPKTRALLEFKELFGRVNVDEVGKQPRRFFR